jgi:hypothetical protein
LKLKSKFYSIEYLFIEFNVAQATNALFHGLGNKDRFLCFYSIRYLDFTMRNREEIFTINEETIQNC